MVRYPLRLRLLAMALAALAGAIDAIGFRHFSGYFVSFMSGNTTRLAVDLLSGSGAALVPAGLIGGFLSGVVTGAVIAAETGERRKRSVMMAVAGLLTGAALAADRGPPWAAALLMTAAMGAMNSVFLREGEVSIGLTYMTGTLVRAGQAIAAALGGARLAPAVRFLLLWLGFLGGACAGAAAYGWIGVAALWFAAGAAWLCGWLIDIAAQAPSGAKAA